MYSWLMELASKKLDYRKECQGVSEELICWFCTDEDWMVDNYGA